MFLLEKKLLRLMPLTHPLGMGVFNGTLSHILVLYSGNKHFECICLCIFCLGVSTHCIIVFVSAVHVLPSKPAKLTDTYWGTFNSNYHTFFSHPLECENNPHPLAFPAGSFQPDSSTCSKMQTWPKFNHHTLDRNEFILKIQWISLT